MDHVWVLISFVFFTALVAVATWLFTRKEDTSSQNGFFLAGRGLTFPFIAGSLLLTNLSTEQMVGLNGDAFAFGLSEMVWDVPGSCRSELHREHRGIPQRFRRAAMRQDRSL